LRLKSVAFEPIGEQVTPREEPVPEKKDACDESPEQSRIPYVRNGGSAIINAPLKGPRGHIKTWNSL